MDSIYKILESFEQVIENKESGVKITNIQWKESEAKLPSSLKLNITAPSGSSNEQIYDRIHDKLKDEYGEADDFEFQFEESLEEAEITPIDHSDDEEDGASAEDIESAITRRMMAHPKFGELVREIDIIDLNDAIEDVARFHAGGDLGTSDVSSMVNDVLKQLKKEGALSEDEELSEMIGSYTIYKDGKVVVTGVRAMSEKDAIQQAYMKMGSASKYTGASRDSFKAVREEVEVNEEDIEENAFNQAAADAARAGKKEFEFDGKTYPVKMDKDTAEKLDDDINEDYNKDEYDEEGEMAKNQLDVACDATKELKAMIEDDENLPEWVQKKITLAMDYLDTARDYMKSVEDDMETTDEVEFELEEDAVEERKLTPSEKERMKELEKEMPMSDFVKRYGKEKGEEVYYATITKMAKKGKKKTDETTVAGAVAVGADATGSSVYGNPSVYESMNSTVENMITESMSVNVSDSTEGEPTVTVSATGEDAQMLSQLLQLAAVKKTPCPGCGRVHEGECMREEDEANSAANTETYDMEYLLNAISGGLNAPKRQINPNNPGDNPMAMDGDKTVNIEESEDTSASHLETLYKEFKNQ